MAESTDPSEQKIINNDYEIISDDDHEQHTQQQLTLLTNEKTTTDENEQDNFSQQLQGADIQIRIDDCMKCYIKITRHQIKKEENVTVKQEKEQEEEEEKVLSQEYPYKPSVMPKKQDLPPKDNEDNGADLNINN